jgi:hypothetical protein
LATALVWALATTCSGAEVQPLGVSLTAPASYTANSLALDLKLPTVALPSTTSPYYVQYPLVQGSMISATVEPPPLNAVGAPAPAPLRVPSSPASTINARNAIYDVSAYDPNTGITFGNYLNDFVGATSFYNYGVLDDNNPNNVVGIFGQDTYVAHIDAGHPFAGPNGAGTLAGVNMTDPNMCYSPSDSAGNSLVITDPQAHATECAMTIAGGGSELATGTSTIRLGIAPLTNLCTGAIATSAGTDGSFSMTAQTYLATFSHFANATWTRNIAYPVAPGISTTISVSGPTDVINASFGITPDTPGTLPETVAVDALARAHPQTTFVISAGNSGPATNTWGGPELPAEMTKVVCG